MSYLEMSSAPLPDMTSGIISVWVRDTTKGDTPAAEEWPSGLWPGGAASDGSATGSGSGSDATGATDSGTGSGSDGTMVPPDCQTLVQTMSPSSVFFWNSYGLPISGSFITLPIFKAPMVMMPVPPPIVTSQMRMFLTFGDPTQTYDYCPWELDFPDVIPGVQYASAGFAMEMWPPPYAPYYIHLGDSDGLFRVANMKLQDPDPKPDMVPQSFMGIDKDGYLVICLQTNVKADYKGYAFAMSNVTPLWAAFTKLVIEGPPYTYEQIGFPLPDGTWEQIPGYWNGYEFEYEDISNKVMAAQSEAFVIGGPPVGFSPRGGPNIKDGNWHHILFSFDISGEVTSKQSETVSAPPDVNSTCKAWLAVDDKNYTDEALQNGVPGIPDGFHSPLLPGMGTDVLGLGPVVTMSRATLDLGPNDIVPQNVWIRGTRGNPREGLLQYASGTPVMDTGNAWTPAGNFNPLAWAGDLWPLYGNGVAPGPWLPVLDPPKPTTPDPKTFDVPTYECSSYSIPVNGFPIGVPVSKHHVKYNAGLEMAELQIWANKSLDTGDVQMRRLFIDIKGKPVPPKIAENMFGRPDVKLHGTGNWKKGFNSGSAGVDPTPPQQPDQSPQSLPPQIHPNGQFTPTAKIEKFTPDPQLGK